MYTVFCLNISYFPWMCDFARPDGHFKSAII